MANKSKKWTYHTSHSFVDVESGIKHTALTQLYQVGVYMIADNDPALQFNLEPKNMVSIEKRLKELELENEIKNLSFGKQITVTTIDGFYEQI